MLVWVMSKCISEWLCVSNAWWFCDHQQTPVYLGGEGGICFEMSEMEVPMLTSVVELLMLLFKTVL